MRLLVMNVIGPDFTVIMRVLTCMVGMVAVMKWWKPKRIMRLEGDQPAGTAMKRHSGAEIFEAWLPYLLLVVFVLAVGHPSIKAYIDTWTHAMLPSFLPKAATGLNGLLVPALPNQLTLLPPLT